MTEEQNIPQGSPLEDKEPEELTDEELAEYNAALEDAMGLPSAAEPVMKGALALGAACSLLCTALVAPDKGTSPAKAAVALVAPLALSAGVGAYLRSVAVPVSEFEEDHEA